MTRHMVFSLVKFMMAAIVLPGGILFSARATEADPQDAVLVSYRLSAADEATFSRTDGKLSPFWQIMRENNLDMVHLTPESHATFRPDPEGFAAGEEDAQITTYSAWGEKGLYFLFEVQDDDFVGYVITGSVEEYHGSTGDKTAEKANDAVELRMCHNSSEELAANYEGLFPEGNNSGNAISMAQYGYRFGGGEPDPEIEVFRRNPSYDPTSQDSTNWQTSLEYLWERYGIDDAAVDKGFEIEVIMGEGSVRYQEWRMAWNQIGMEGAFVKPVEGGGKKIALIVGYNDVDQGYANNSEDVLRWQRAEPFWQPREKGLGAWGDLEFGGALAGAKGFDPAAQPILSPYRVTPVPALPAIHGFAIDGRRVVRRTGVGAMIEVTRESGMIARRRITR